MQIHTEGHNKVNVIQTITVSPVLSELETQVKDHHEAETRNNNTVKSDKSE